MVSALKEEIQKAGLFYKEVGDRTGYSANHVSVDVSRVRLTAEKAIRYARALKIDPAVLRPDIFKPGEVTFSGDK